MAQCRLCNPSLCLRTFVLYEKLTCESPCCVDQNTLITILNNQQTHGLWRLMALSCPPPLHVRRPSTAWGWNFQGATGFLYTIWRWTSRVHPTASRSFHFNAVTLAYCHGILRASHVLERCVLAAHVEAPWPRGGSVLAFLLATQRRA